MLIFAFNRLNIEDILVIRHTLAKVCLPAKKITISYHSLSKENLATDTYGC